MAYFDVQKDTQIVVDASPVGISAILSQAVKGSNEFRIVAYASRALTDVEQRYSQREREALSIVWGYRILWYPALWTPYVICNVNTHVVRYEISSVVLHTGKSLKVSSYGGASSQFADWWAWLLSVAFCPTHTHKHAYSLLRGSSSSQIVV